FPNPQRRRAQSAPAAPSPGPSSDGSPAPPTRPALPPSERLQPPAFPSIMSPNEQDYDPINFAIRTLGAGGRHGDVEPALRGYPRRVVGAEQHRRRRRFDDRRA